MVKMILTLNQLAVLKKNFPNATITQVSNSNGSSFEYTIAGVEENLLGPYGKIVAVVTPMGTTQPNTPSAPPKQESSQPSAHVASSQNSNDTPTDFSLAMQGFIFAIVSPMIAPLDSRIKNLIAQMEETSKLLEEVRNKSLGGLDVANEKIDTGMKILEARVKTLDDCTKQQLQDIHSIVESQKQKAEAVEITMQKNFDEYMRDKKNVETDINKVTTNQAKVVKYLKELPLPE